MKKVLIVSLLALSLNAQGLKSLLESANSSNLLLKRDALKEQSAKKGIEAVNSSYYPLVDIGGLAKSDNPKTPMRPGTTYVGFVKLNYIVYDGGKRAFTKHQKRYELSSIKDANMQFRQSLYLQIVQDYFSLKSLDALIEALRFKKEAIASQYKKIKAFREAGIVGDVELFQLKSALESVKFNLSSLNLQRQTLLSNLSLKVGKRVKRLGSSHFIKKSVGFESNYLVKSLRAKVASIKQSAKAVGASNMPMLNLTLEHNRYGYDRVDRAHPKGLGSQSTITLSGKLRVFDGGATSNQAEAIKLQAISLAYEANYRLKEQKNSFKLSKLRIKNIRVQIKSAKSALISAQKNYDAVLKKYNAGIIDNTEYLDALSNLAEAKANYKKALNDLEVAYGLYYFSAGGDLSNFVR